MGTKRKEPGNEKKCCRWGWTGHLAQVKSCPALDKTCNKCSRSRHFEACCKKKTTEKPSGRKHSKGASQVSEEKEDNYAFVLYAKNSQGSGGVVDLWGRCAVKKSFLLTRGQQRRLLPDWLFESLVFSLLTARNRVNKDGCQWENFL